MRASPVTWCNAYKCGMHILKLNSQQVGRPVDAIIAMTARS